MLPSDINGAASNPLLLWYKLTNCFSRASRNAHTHLNPGEKVKHIGLHSKYS